MVLRQTAFFAVRSAERSRDGPGPSEELLQQRSTSRTSRSATTPSAPSPTSTSRAGPSSSSVRTADLTRGGPTATGRERPLGRGRKRKATTLNPAPGIRIDNEDYLITSTVQAPTLARYGAAVAAFEKFAHGERFSLGRKRVDRSMKIYFVALFEDGFSAVEGRNVFYGYRLLRLRTTGRSVLPLARASLKGWQRRVPGRIRLPVTEDVALQIGCDLILHRHPHAALVMALRLDAYLRPSEAVELRMAQLLPPAPNAGKQFAGRWGVVIAPQEFKETTKSGQTDDSMVIADKAHAWLNAALAFVYQRGAPDTQPVFPKRSLPHYERLIAESAKRLGLDRFKICPHVFPSLRSFKRPFPGASDPSRDPETWEVYKSKVGGPV